MFKFKGTHVIVNGLNVERSFSFGLLTWGLFLAENRNGSVVYDEIGVPGNSTKQICGQSFCNRNIYFYS